MPIAFRDYFEGLQISIHSAGNYKMPNMHYHDAYEIYILEDGDRSYVVEDRLLHLRPRDVLLIKPDKIHCTAGGTFVRTLVTFTDKYLYRFYNENGINSITKCFEKDIIRVRESDFEMLLFLVKKLYDDENDILAFSHLLSILENNMSRSTYDLKNTGSKISDIVDYITENYKTIDNLDMMADKFYISKQYLCNLFKECTGTSIIKYINILKIHSSIEMLAAGKLSMAEIAEKSGFKSLSNFSKTFKSVTGMSPLKYSKTALAAENDSQEYIPE